jgi:hypothetical protein
MGEATENLIAVVVLSVLCVIYLYLLLTPLKTEVSSRRNFAIPRFVGLMVTF